MKISSLPSKISTKISFYFLTVLSIRFQAQQHSTKDLRQENIKRVFFFVVCFLIGYRTGYFIDACVIFELMVTFTYKLFRIFALSSVQFLKINE